MNNILIIDDDQSLCYSLIRVFEKKYNIKAAHNSLEAMDQLSNQNFNLILLDFRLGDEDGLDVLQKIKAFKESIPIVIMTAYGSSRVVIESINLGAIDYLVKPIQVEELDQVIQKYSLKLHTHNEKNCFPIDPKGSKEPDSFIGSSKPTNEILKTVAMVAKTNSPVLISGESGTGKELVARLVHDFSKRKGKPFVAINCAAIPENLLESELFGYIRGAFSGADHNRIGKFEFANGGTVFLDEIGDMPIKLQAKLLRFLQEGSFEMLGENHLKSVDVRIISATNQNITEQVQVERFRRDLYYRLNGITIQLPPLRDRKKDLKDLLIYYVNIYGNSYQKKILCIDKDILPLLESHDWPGNVREFQNVVRNAVVLTNSNHLIKDHFKIEKKFESQEHLQNQKLYDYFQNKFPTNLFSQSINLIEKELLYKTLKKNNFHRTKSADELGISRVTLNAKIKKYDLNKKEP